MSDAGGECCSRASQMCGGSTGHQMEDECAPSTSSHMCRHLRQPLADRLWQGSYGLGNVLWNPQQPFTVRKLCLKPMNQPLQRRL